jgi:hypothetical protein
MNNAIVRLAQDWAMDDVFNDRPNGDSDWDDLAEQVFNDREGFDGFVPCERYYGYSNDYVVGAVNEAFDSYMAFAKAAVKDFTDECLHADELKALATGYMEALQ